MPASFPAALEGWLLRQWFAAPDRRSWFTLLAGLPARVTAHVAGRRRAEIVANKRLLNANRIKNKEPITIIVGNLVAGGGGKTPLTLALAESLGGRGLSVGIVCRGHGSADPLQATVVTGQAAVEQVGDEALLLALASGLPVVAGRARAPAVALLKATVPGLDVILSDDGLTHRSLARHVELAVFDRRGTGNGRLLPAGPLREPLAHLATMDAVVRNHGWLAPGQTSGQTRWPAHPRVFDSHLVVRDVISLADWAGDTTVGHESPPGANPAILPTEPPVSLQTLAARGRPVAAIAGIAHPEGFFDLLRQHGLTVEPYRPGDHRAMSPPDLQTIGTPVILLTEKDAVKYRHLRDPRLHVLRIAARPQVALTDWLEKEIRG
ncbi:MAG: tetraacyldisaccharide 4'-kinase [Burkholderiaceae bacterium]